MRRAILLVALLGGCDRCDGCKDKVKAHLAEPSKDAYDRELARQLPSAAQQASILCGIPVSGLGDVKVTRQAIDSKQFHVEGKPLFADGGRPPKGSVPASCIGDVSMTATPIVDDANNVTGFEWKPFTVESVETPGVSWKKPSGGGGWD